MEREMERDSDDETIIGIESMFGLFTNEGRVKLELRRADRRLHVLLAPAEARAQAMYLLEAAGAAERDAAFWKVARDLGMDDEAAARFMLACRDAHRPG
ncbi:MAG: hypothetical protein NVSMB19_15950 [Vulcanimicrobiaceae bacterium]